VYPVKTTYLSQVTDKLYQHNVVLSTPRHERGSNPYTCLQFFSYIMGTSIDGVSITQIQLSHDQN
jgi:hypothetical protein